MSRSNLALLDRAVQGAVALELGDGDHDKSALAELGVVPQRTRTVAGLKVVSNAARDAEVDPNSAKMTDKLLRYRADRELVIGKLKRVGVEPIAVLPLTAWERICDSTGLYRFKPNGDQVRVSASNLFKQAEKYARAKASERHDGFMIACLATWFVLTVGCGLLGYNVHPGWYFPMAAIGFFGFLILIAGIVDGPMNSRPRDIEAARIRELVAEHEKNGTLIKELWPDLKEPAKGENIRIALPEPPADVQERLIAAERARLPLNIAVVGDAIAFKELVADVLVGIRGKYWDEVERLEALNRDPIAYVIEGTAVAIIDQYGEFPIEKEVINKVINSEHLV